jgi:YfiH family protein
VPLRVVVTTRAGGVSAAPYDTNNLALHVGDAADAVGANRQRLAELLGTPRVHFMHQVHGSDVAVVAGETAGSPDVDVLVTAEPGVALAVLVADCVPVVVAGSRVSAVIHAGRRGVQSDVVGHAVAAVREVYDGPLAAHIGPAICGSCYEVPADMQADVCDVVPEARSTTRRGTAGLDLVAAVRAQLARRGVEQFGGPTVCTAEDARYYSHRRDGVTGRFAMVAMLTR